MKDRNIKARCASCVAYMGGSCMLTDLAVDEDDECVDFRVGFNYNFSGHYE